jgi:acyl-CoA dehydrogenase
MTATTDLAIIDHLLRASPDIPEPVLTFGEWKQGWCMTAPNWTLHIDRAIAGGLTADRPAWVFAAGYQSAMQCLMNPAGDTEVAAICINEKGPTHPAQIKSSLIPDPANSDNWLLDGAKSFVSGAGEVDILWVAASTGKTSEGRNQLRMVRVPVHSPGVTLEPLPPLGIVPEMPHARVRFESVALTDDAVLPGDGYLDTIKPFRTLEDLHVTAAFLAWFFGIGRRAGWSTDILENIVALIASARSLAVAPLLDPCLHIALGGFLGQVSHLQTSIEPLWQDADSTITEMWQRDRKILEIAGAARQKRLATAWLHYNQNTT